ncbi:MAG: hypothetical protein A2171_02075 [Candidatus Levybacteria bacterium RBG_13_35_9]|nr:MAG: hypothetical protein A2171_02075 [Candidatus Levybacteria bacterium RBG_13_35_9]
MSKILVYTDGGSRGNPGQSALGVYIVNEKKEKLFSTGKRLGHTTNNVAEYSAILEAFFWLMENKSNFSLDTEIYFYMDSLLAYSQLVGLFKIKNAVLRDILFEIRKKEQELGLKITYAHIRREQNKKADEMVNLALDNKL